MNASKFAAALTLIAACATPVMAQSTSGAGGAGGTSATQSTPAAAADTRTMGSGPSVETGRTESRDTDRDLGWIGLLGLAGLLGMRRKHDDHPARDNRTTGPAR